MESDSAARTFYYYLFGLPFETDAPIPGVAESERDTDAIRVRFGTTPAVIDDAVYTDESVQSSATEYLFTRPHLVRLHIRGGSDITLEDIGLGAPEPQWQFVLGIGASIAGWRRGFIPLHASAVETCGGCVALAGQSGAGKSTLAASLTGLGFTLFGDDLCLVRPQAEGPPLVGTGLRETHLCGDAAEALDWPAERQAAVPPEQAKKVYRFAAAAPADMPLERIYVLQFAEGDGPAGIERLEGVAALQAVIDCLRMRRGLLRIGARDLSFANLAAISSTVAVFRFTRPRDRSQLLTWSRRLAAHLST